MTAFNYVCLVLMPIMFLIGFFYGFRIAKSVYITKDIGIESMPLGKAIEKIEQKIEMYNETDEERIRRITDINIENFGTDIPQIDIN